MPPNRAALIVLTLLATVWPSSGFLWTPSMVPSSIIPKEQATKLRTRSHFSSSLPSAGRRRRRTPLVTTRQRSCPRRLSFPVLTVVPDIDDVDPLDAGPDIDPLDAGPDVVGPMGDGKEGAYDDDPIDVATLIKKRSGDKVSAATLEEEDADAASMAALAAAAKDTAEKQQKKKKARKRSDPLMPKGAPGPLDWREYATLKEGVRGHLVVLHTGLPKDQAVADSLIRQVKERFGDVVHVNEEVDDDEDTTEEERLESNAFEVWLEGPEVVVYHARGECKVDLTEDQIGKILDDLETRVADESILHVHCTKEPQFVMPGMTLEELRAKAFYPL